MSDKSLICAIETSCDETAIAFIENGNRVLSNIVSSQIDTHRAFGGVMPEVASRLHIEQISLVLKEAIDKSGVSMNDVDAIAFTQGPGLIGSLHIGVLASKTLGWYFQKPLVPVHHIAGHIYANSFVTDLKFPLLALVVSGGHTELVYMKEDYDFEILGTTQDDAIGEAYDKVARVLQLGYPGGPAIDTLAKQGTTQYILPRVKTEKPLDFSFSGLKSAVLQLVLKEERHGRELNKANLAYAFQEAVLDEVLLKTKKALEMIEVKQVVLAGGVSANSRLRERLIQMMQGYPDIACTIPPLWCTTDNAAMIGAAGAVAFKKGILADYSTSAKAGYDL
ncbi:MAG: tRNA (adenosine(37)-N6)-threonylcarbamoyltransferase complex transferase subunit TsaD [Firmicutes bacterium HGW-Firmicutes-20]|nr:MAG: tRNA (adenosine(37)-N6)-threonylcarbamoyltransferase complex transferase subunit TsaD [Firmicutes bacterium HGW-Firmicutes-20]